MQRRVVLGFVFLALLIAGPMRAQRVTPTGTLVVVVNKVDGTPQPGARVYLQPSDGRTPHTAQTDATGHFRFEKVRVGLYDLRAQAGGLWSDLQQNVNVKADQEVSVELQLKPASPPKPKNP
jgi:uncharacterized protein YfaS (alpha-2-macroglobulin family)